MNSRIHKFINSFFRFFVPTIYILFILAGLIAALVSGLIEYEIFAELYKKSDGNTNFSIFSIPFLVVFCFEIVKIFLIFLNKQADLGSNGAYYKDKTHFLRLRYILIFISFFCTLFYSFYNLQNPEYDKLLAEEQSDLRQQHELKLKQLNERYDNQIIVATENANEQIKIYDERMVIEEGFKFANRQEYRGPRFNEAKRNKEKQERRRDSIISVKNNQRDQAITNLNEQLEDDIETAGEDMNKSNVTGNKIIRATLGTFKKDFPEWAYIIIVGIISLILSIGLEYIIWASFTVLAMNHGEIFEFGIMRDKYKNTADAEIEIEDIKNKTDTKKAQQHAESILTRAKNKARDIIRNLRNDLNKN